MFNHWSTTLAYGLRVNRPIMCITIIYNNCFAPAHLVLFVGGTHVDETSRLRPVVGHFGTVHYALCDFYTEQSITSFHHLECFCPC